jgi:hypothetical protein
MGGPRTYPVDPHRHGALQTCYEEISPATRLGTLAAGETNRRAPAIQRSTRAMATSPNQRKFDWNDRLVTVVVVLWALMVAAKIA